MMILALDEKRCYREVILPGNEPQGLVIEPALQRADHGWISREDGPAKASI
jgi:hypothetical protein